ncbi:MAG: methionine biosynthesis protein MetW [Victivallales bacterium]|nr:methionine biosynthesis protein MetW [Victivallales bacterium]
MNGNSKYDNDLLYEKTLASFGIRSDCSFETLRQCARQFQNTGDTSANVGRGWHDHIIQRLVNSGDSLIDLGCGDGELMARLSYTCKCWVQGIESNEELVNRCVERGLPVCHADIEDILDILPDKNYTWAVLEDTLQTLQNPLDVLEKMLRVANKSIVSFPNFAHWSVRFTFSLGGRMPVTKSLPNKWYNTPNIHLCSISDFQDWIRQDNVTILEAWVLINGEVREFDPSEGHNISAEQALFVLQRN